MESVVVTGAGRGIGRAVCEHLLASGVAVVACDLDPAALGWVDQTAGAAAVAGDAGDESVAAAAAARARDLGTLTGWVNNAAVFSDLSLHPDGAHAVLEVVHRNLDPYVVGSAAAVRSFLATGTGGSIVNVSSHQAQRPVPGSLPYATAKAAVEGLTRAVAVDHGSAGIRANAVALGSIDTGRPDARRPEIAALHALGRVGRAAEVAEVVTWLLSPASAFVTGAVLPVDGGRSVLARED